MDGKYFNIAAAYLDNLEIFPYFNICHYILVSLFVRQLSPGNKAFSRQHPLGSWFATIIMCFAGSFLSNLLVGEAIIIPLKSHENIFHASICWYLINYFPFDLCYHICSFVPINLLLSLANELYRARMVHIGVTVAVKRYPNYVIPWLLIGVVKGCGEDILVPIVHMLMGIFDSRTSVLLYPSFNVKGSLTCAIIFSIETLHKLPLVSNQMFLASLLFLAYFRVSSILVGIKDPFVPFENLICGLFFGGLVDSIKSLSQRQNSTTSNDKGKQYNAYVPSQSNSKGGLRNKEGVRCEDECNCEKKQVQDNGNDVRMRGGALSGSFKKDDSGNQQ